MEGAVRPLLMVKSGVLQSCRLSSTLFTLAIDPLLWVFSRTVVASNLGVVTACADDIAIALRNMASLKIAHDIFTRFEAVSGLTLSAHKCILILLSAEVHSHNAALVSLWLSSNIVSWKHFEIANSGTYLGFCLGPPAGKLMWQGALTKYKQRIDSIALAHEATSLSVASYNSRALPTLGYIAQLVPSSPQTQAARSMCFKQSSPSCH